jgi:hypothetical protein
MTKVVFCDFELIDDKTKNDPLIHIEDFDYPSDLGNKTDSPEIRALRFRINNQLRYVKDLIDSKFFEFIIVPCNKALASRLLGITHTAGMSVIREKINNAIFVIPDKNSRMDFYGREVQSEFFTKRNTTIEYLKRYNRKYRAEGRLLNMRKTDFLVDMLRTKRTQMVPA